MTLAPPPANNNKGPAESAWAAEPERVNPEKAAVAENGGDSLPPVAGCRPFRCFSAVGKRVMVVGPTGSGKSSLLKALGLIDEPVSKTEHVRINPTSIDTPGEMLDIPSLYHALIISSVKAGVILFIADPTRKCSFPVRMAKALRAPVVGVITKADLAGPEDKARAHKALKQAGVERAVETSIVDSSGLAELVELIANLK